MNTKFKVNCSEVVEFEIDDRLKSALIHTFNEHQIEEVESDFNEDDTLPYIFTIKKNPKYVSPEFKIKNNNTKKEESETLDKQESKSAEPIAQQESEKPEQPAKQELTKSQRNRLKKKAKKNKNKTIIQDEPKPEQQLAESKVDNGQIEKLETNCIKRSASVLAEPETKKPRKVCFLLFMS